MSCSSSLRMVPSPRLHFPSRELTNSLSRLASCRLAKKVSASSLRYRAQHQSGKEIRASSKKKHHETRRTLTTPAPTPFPISSSSRTATKMSYCQESTNLPKHVVKKLLLKGHFHGRASKRAHFRDAQSQDDLLARSNGLESIAESHL